MNFLKRSKKIARTRLAEILQDKQMTQVELAKLTGLSPQTISAVVNQPQMIRLDTIGAICDALGVSPGELIVYEGEE